MYGQSKYTVKGVENDLSIKHFKTASGVKQGCVLSPSIFIIILEMILQVALKDTKEGDRLRNRICKLLGYADDLVMSDISLQKLIEDLEDLDNAVSAANMKISEDKSKMLTIGGEPTSKTQKNWNKSNNSSTWDHL